MAFPGMDYGKTWDLAACVEHGSSRGYAPACQRDIISHLVDVTAFTAKIVLPVDEYERGSGYVQCAIVRPDIKISSSSTIG